MTEIIQNYQALSTLLISSVALLISIIALYFTARSFLLKSGYKLRSDISTANSIDSDEIYIGSVTLENLKDRAAIIFSIYLQLGRGNYLQIENFENKPLILKPFEVYYKEFDPVIFYSTGTDKLSISALLADRKIKKKILLSTTKGKYTVKTDIDKWHPVLKLFNNHYTALIDPIRYSIKGKSYGNRVKYILVFKYQEKEEVIKINEKRESLLKFKNFTLTKESLESAEELKCFLEKKRAEEKIHFDQLEVIDFQKRIKQTWESYDSDALQLEKNNFWDYNIKGWIYSKISDYKMEKENRKFKKNLNQRK